MAQPKIGCPPCQPYDFGLEKGPEKLMKLGEELIHHYNQQWRKVTGNYSEFTSFTDVYMTLSFLHQKYIQTKDELEEDKHPLVPSRCRKENVSGEKAKLLLKKLLTPEIRKETIKFLEELEKVMIHKLTPENQIMIKNTNIILNHPAYK
jgi:hypothetical protein